MKGGYLYGIFLMAYHMNPLHAELTDYAKDTVTGLTDYARIQLQD